MSEKPPLQHTVSLNEAPREIPDGLSILEALPESERSEAVTAVLSLSPEDQATLDRVVLNPMGANFGFFDSVDDPDATAEALRAWAATEPGSRAELTTKLQKLLA